MKNIHLLGALAIGAASLFVACSDDNDSNPTLVQPTEFVLNMPAYATQLIDLNVSESVNFTWTQPKYTSDYAPVNITYEIQVSLNNSFKVSSTEADADESGATVADYAVIDKTTTECKANVAAADFAKALMKVGAWAEDAVPEELSVYVRVNAYVVEGSAKLNSIVSNVVKITVKPYYMELKNVAPIMWYLVGNNFGDGMWQDNPGVSSFPMFLQSGYTYDKATGTGEIVYLNYFDTDGWKIQPANFDWNYGFMNGGSANSATYRNGEGDAGDIKCNPAGYYLVTVNTGSNECTIARQEITPTVYDQICIAGSFNGWTDDNMHSVNKNTENHVWCYTLTVAEGTVEEIKFKIPDSWDPNWGYGTAPGEINVCGKGTNGGNNIGVPEGTWIIMFNDITGEFSIVAKKE